MEVTIYKLILFKLLFIFALVPLSKISDSNISVLVNREVASSVNALDCKSHLDNIALRASSYMLEAEYKKELPAFERSFKNSFSQSRDYITMSFRAKSSSSIFSKISKRGLRGLSDGLGARLIVKDPSEKNMSLIFKDLLDSVREKQIVFSEIRNYRLPSGHEYFSDDQVRQLVSEQKAVSGIEAKVIIGSESIRPKSYVSFHMKLISPGLGNGEFQLRGKLIQDLNEIDHLFYDIMELKGLSEKFKSNNEIINIAKTFDEFPKSKKEKYLNYLGQQMRYVREIEKGIYSERGPPPLPEDFSENPELSLENLMLVFEKYL